MVTLVSLIAIFKLTNDLKNLLEIVLVIILPLKRDSISSKEIEFLLTPHAWPTQIFLLVYHAYLDIGNHIV